MNRKGFTLIELLSVVVILGIIMAIAIPSISNVYQNSKEKSEEIFISELSNVIEDYITLNTSKIIFSNTASSTIEKCDENDNCNFVNVYVNTNPVTLADLISEGLISESDLINPNGKITCDATTVIDIYKDEDYVFCHKVKINCVDDNDLDNYEIDTCMGDTE